MAGCLSPDVTPTPTTAVADLPTTTLQTAVPVASPTLAVGETAVVPTSTPPQPQAYPAPTGAGDTVFLPVITDEMAVTATPAPTHTPQPTPTPIPTVDFAAVSAQLAANGQALAPVKIGFHVGIGGNTTGLEEWMRRLDAAGVPFFLKSVDNAQPILFAQELRRQSGVPHVLVFRKAAGGDYDWDVPNYDAPPDIAAQQHWQAHVEAFPPELDRSMVWLETINEIDKNEAEWLGQFALTTAELALRDGFNWAAFGWASGEPEPHQWQTPSMLAFLRLAGQYPDRLAVALHEYSYEVDDIGDAYPYKIGRFQELFRIADANGIPRPTVLITEWGWTYEHVPPPDEALADIAWAAQLYAPFPEVKGAAIWYLGSGFADIHNETQQLIRPLTLFTLQNYFAAPQPPNKAPIQPQLFQP